MHLNTYSARTVQTKSKRMKPQRCGQLIYVYYVCHPGRILDCPKKHPQVLSLRMENLKDLNYCGAHPEVESQDNQRAWLKYSVHYSSNSSNGGGPLRRTYELVPVGPTSGRIPVSRYVAGFALENNMKAQKV